MASGCIISECHVCYELIWEDEPWEFHNDKIIHKRCLGNAMLKNKAMFLQEKRIDSMKEDLEMLKKMMKSCSDEIQRLEKLISKESE